VAFALISSGTWADLWPLFGSANQLLAALALLTATVWLANWDESKQLISTGVPMALMTAITVIALLYLQVYQNFYLKVVLGNWGDAGASLAGKVSVGVQIVIGLVLIYLALSLVRLGYGNIRNAQRGRGAAVADGGTGDDD
jgi:carbon starvation protein